MSNRAARRLGYVTMYTIDSQLQAERDTQHLKPLHLKVDADRRLVVLIKSILAKSK